MTPIQKAMCAVIRESGFEGLSRIGKSISASREQIQEPVMIRDTFARYRAGEWSLTIDGHTLTQQEYEEWTEKQKSS